MNAYWPYYDVWADSFTPTTNIKVISNNRKLEALLLERRLPPELKRMCSGITPKKILNK